ncbi:hypothetical protein MSAN_01478700 [Mycena sanguinolenta]|uniref:F-box domain-containing protein n=1 Tax=Mycena sanguinolenta TaxID=230812 RepID=A0A8H7CYT8_9AGAR|nr:hypothetical protein MSAN_01478700 [Mycena sanguinolenta]
MLANSADYFARSTIANRNAAVIADLFQAHAGKAGSPVLRVFYPSLSDTAANYAAFMRPATAEFSPGYGCLLSIDFTTLAAARAFYDNLQVHKGPHLGAHLTLAFNYNDCLGKDPKAVQYQVGYGLRERAGADFDGIGRRKKMPEDNATLKEESLDRLQVLNTLWLCYAPFLSLPIMESPFSHLFSTNYVPTDEEIHHIQIDLISRTEELARINERLREFSSQRDQLQAYVESHKALISSPRRLPPDVVQQIFVACLPTKMNAVMSVEEPPLLLCQICSAWRTIALSIPILWSTIHVSFDFVLSYKSRILAVTKWLQRSATRPLSLSICFDRPSSNDPSREKLLKCLAKSSHRWGHVEFQNCSPTTAQDIAEFKLSALESFKFGGDSSTFNEINLAETQTMRVLSIQDPQYVSNAALLASPLTWDQLTHLTIRGGGPGPLSLRNVVVLLGRCTRLISFYFTPIANEWIDFTTLDLVSVPCLETFGIPASSYCTWKPSAIIRFMERVSMPQLRRFRVQTKPSAGAESFFLVSLGTRSPLVEELNLHLESLTSRSLPQTLRSFPALTTLIVCDTYHGSTKKDPGFDPVLLTQLLACLTPGFGAVLCPALQELVITTLATNSELQKSTLDAFIEKRLECTPGFRRLDLKFHYNRSDGCWKDAPSDLVLFSEDEIQSYILRGLNISIGIEYFGLSPSAWTGLPWEFRGGRV